MSSSNSLPGWRRSEKDFKKECKALDLLQNEPMMGEVPPEKRKAVSALYLEPPTDVEWRIVLREKLLEDVQIALIP